MKKLLVVLLGLVLMLAVVACGKKDNAPEDTKKPDTPVEDVKEEENEDVYDDGEKDHQLETGSYTNTDLAVIVCDKTKTADELEVIAKEAGHINLDAMINWLVQQNALYYIPNFTYFVEDGENVFYEGTYTYPGTEIYNAALEMGVIDKNDAETKEECEDNYLAVLVNNGDYSNEVLEEMIKDFGYNDLQTLINHLIQVGKLYYVPRYSYINERGEKIEVEAGYCIHGTGRYYDAVKIGIIDVPKVDAEIK